MPRSESGLDIPADAASHIGPHTIMVKTCHVETELVGVLSEIVVFERLLAMEEQLVHGPEAVLKCGCFGGRRRAECMWVDLDEREVSERETN